MYCKQSHGNPIRIIEDPVESKLPKIELFVPFDILGVAIATTVTTKKDIIVKYKILE